MCNETLFHTEDEFHHLVLSVPGTLATIMASLLHCFLSEVTSLSSSIFIPVTSCISSIHLLIGRPLLLLPFPPASIIPFSNPSHSLIHSGHFYSAPSSPLPLRGAPDYSTDTVSEFHAEAHRQLQVKDLPKVPT